jgi:Secretion system C-terminal sorting domain
MKQILPLLIAIGLLVIESAKAQQVISSTGGIAQSYSGTLSYTLGEVVIDTYTKSNTAITQGFQQPKIAITAINEFPGLDVSITAFPNPTTGFIELKTEKGKSEKMEYTLYDLGGKILLQGKLENGETEISLGQFIPATYFIRIRITDKEVKTFKIIKQ